MKQRDEHLFDLAFGDLRGDAAEAVVRQMSDDESSLVEELRCMKLDLARLPVPEHQLSTERMRNAILSQGLEQRPASGAWWKLAMMPVAAAAIAVVGYQAIFANKQGPMPSKVVAIADSDSLTASSSATGVGTSGFDSSRMEFDPDHWFNGSETVQTGPAPSTGISRSASRVNRSRAPIVPDSPSTSVDSPTPKALVSKSTQETGAESLVATGGAASVELKGRDTNGGIVLIGTETDSTTGANRAIEVQDSRDVLIGG